MSNTQKQHQIYQLALFFFLTYKVTNKYGEEEA